MIERSFSLQPFPFANALDDVRIAGDVVRRAGAFGVRFTISGRLGGLAIPAPSPVPARRDRLWESTCFEFFLAFGDSPRYWEFNLSPSGCWNVYSFSAYREGMRVEEAFTALPFDVAMGEDSLALGLEMDLERIVRADRPVDVAVSAVVRRMDGSASYWALKHCGPQPDFHLRESFAIRLRGSRYAT